jgi:hypothetical protein
MNGSFRSLSANGADEVVGGSPDHPCRFTVKIISPRRREEREEIKD